MLFPPGRTDSLAGTSGLGMLIPTFFFFYHFAVAVSIILALAASAVTVG